MTAWIITVRIIFGLTGGTDQVFDVVLPSQAVCEKVRLALWDTRIDGERHLLAGECRERGKENERP